MELTIKWIRERHFHGVSESTANFRRYYTLTGCLRSIVMFYSQRTRIWTRFTTQSMRSDESVCIIDSYAITLWFESVTNDLLCAVDNQQAVMLILLDSSAAFNTMDHNILFQHLHEEIGVCGVPPQWFKS